MCIISPACSGSVLQPPSSWTYQKNLQRDATMSQSWAKMWLKKTCCMETKQTDDMEKRDKWARSQTGLVTKQLLCSASFFNNGRNWTLLPTYQLLLQEADALIHWGCAFLHLIVPHLSAYYNSQPARHHLHLPLQVLTHLFTLSK